MNNAYYYNYYSTPVQNYVDYALVIAIAAIAAGILGVVLYFTFFSRKNEGKFTGMKEKLYNLMTFNRFYAEDILKFVYIVSTCILTVCGIATIILGSFISGILLLVVANLALRVAFELLMMFIMLCRKTVSMDRKLSRIANYYDDGYEEYCGENGAVADAEIWTEEDPFQQEDAESCGGDCGSCGVEDCSTMEESEIDTVIDSIKEDQQ